MKKPTPMRDRVHESYLWGIAAKVAAMMPIESADAEHVLKTAKRLLADRAKTLQPLAPLSSPPATASRLEASRKKR